MKAFELIRAHLADNAGDENISKMVWVCIVFTVGAILLLLVTHLFQGSISNWYKKVVNSWFDGNGANGKYISANATTSK